MLHPLVHKTAAAMMFQMGDGGVTMTTIKTMMFQMGEGGFTMTTMQVFSRFMKGHYGQYGIVRHSGTRKFQNPEFS